MAAKKAAPKYQRMSAKTDEDRRIEKRQYFDHWENRAGERKAIFKPIVADYVVRALEEDDIDAQHDMAIAFAEGTQIWDPEARKTVRPARWWIDFAEGRSDAIDVFYRKSAWAYRCVEIRSQALAQAPYQIVGADGETVMEDSALGTLLKEVNPECNWLELIGYTEADLCIYGNAYWLKVRKGKNAPVFIQRLSPKAVEAKIGSEGIERFIYRSQGVPRDLARQDVVYFHRYNPDSQLIGLSPLEVCRKAMQVEAAADDHMQSFFENRAMPQFIMSAPTQDQNELNRLSAVWKQMYGKNKSIGGTAFVGGGAEPKEMGYAPDKLALKDVREEARKSICASLGVPPVLVGAWEAANYATAGEQRKGLYTETIVPDGEYIASVINAELAPDMGAETFVWEWDQLMVLQEDQSLKAERVALLVTTKIIRPEVASLEMGYDAADVPEPVAAPEPVQPTMPGMPDSTAADELAKWNRKAIKRLKDGKSPAIAFKSEILPAPMVDSILGSLEACKTSDQVNKVFTKVRTWQGYL